MSCPACDAPATRTETTVGVMPAVIYKCTECVWQETMYFDTIEDDETS
jgi:hypothetical protein